MFASQAGFDIRCEWGLAGLEQFIGGELGEKALIIIVDVLSFSTSVEIAVSRGALVYPFPWRNASAESYAKTHGALLAGAREGGGYSLSPASLTGIPDGTRLVLPSPNGGALCWAARGATVYAGSLRNAAAVARAAHQFDRPVCIIPAGERWPDGNLRPAIEDWTGAGAIIHALPGSRSPEAAAAEAAFLHFRYDLFGVLQACASGQELISRGFAQDVALAAMLDVSVTAPVLEWDHFR